MTGVKGSFITPNRPDFSREGCCARAEFRREKALGIVGKETQEVMGSRVTGQLKGWEKGFLVKINAQCNFRYSPLRDVWRNCLRNLANHVSINVFETKKQLLTAKVFGLPTCKQYERKKSGIFRNRKFFFTIDNLGLGCMETMSLLTAAPRLNAEAADVYFDPRTVENCQLVIKVSVIHLLINICPVVSLKTSLNYYSLLKMAWRKMSWSHSLKPGNLTMDPCTIGSSSSRDPVWGLSSREWMDGQTNTFILTSKDD